MNAATIADAGTAVVVVVLLAFCGFGVLRGLAAGPRFDPEGMGLSFLVGASVLAILVTICGAIGPVAGAATLVVGTAGAGAIGCWVDRGRRRAGTSPSEASPAGDAPVPHARETARAWLEFLPALAVVGLSLWLAVQRPVWNVDAQRRWLLHAQWLADTGTIVPERMQDPSWASAHPTYPPLVPSIAALALELGADRDLGLRPLFPFFLFALLAAVHGYARGRLVNAAGGCAWPDRRPGPPIGVPFGRGIAAAVPLALGLTPCLTLLGGIGMGSDAALADVPLAALLTALAILVLRALESRGPTPDRGSSVTWGAASLVAAGAILTKNEGMVFVPLMLLATIVWARGLGGRKFLGPSRGPRSPALRVARVALVASIVVAAGWKTVASSLPIETGEDYVSLGVTTRLVAGLGRLPEIAVRFLREGLSTETWGLLWMLPLAWVIVGIVSRVVPRRTESIERSVEAASRVDHAALVATWLAIGVATLAAAYAATGWKEGAIPDAWAVLMDVSLTRLLMHHAPLVALLLVAAFADAYRPRASEVASRPKGGGDSTATFLLPAILLVSTCLAPSCAPRASGDSPSDGRPVVLISIDSLRADHCSAYGHRARFAPDEPTTPFLERASAEGLLFERCTSTTSWTLPAHVSLLTGMSCQEHGVRNRTHRLRPDVETLASRLRDAGYRTAGFYSGPFLHPSWGFGTGFDTYRPASPYLEKLDTVERMLELDEPSAILPVHDASHGDTRCSERVVDAALAWLEEGRRFERPFFLFLHLWDPHYDYEPPPEYAERFHPGYDGPVDGRDFMTKRWSLEDRPRLVALYDAEIRYTDDQIARFFRALERLGVADDTILAITADHGEEFYEHGRKGHQKTLFEEVLHVPLVVRAKGLVPQGLRVGGVASLADLAPTLLDLAAVPGWPEREGRSLRALWEADDPGRPALLDLDMQTGGERIRGVRDGSRKVLWDLRASRWDLFDLAVDPRERSAIDPSRSEEDASRVRRARRILEDAERLPGHAIPSSEWPEMTELLEQLGYTGGG